MAYTPPPRPACSAEHSPGNGGYDGSSIEAEGVPGNKMESPGYLGSMAGEDGNHEIGPQQANAAAHGRPPVGLIPDNMQSAPAVGPHGAIDGPDPYSLTDFPHKGAPERTWNAGGGAGTNIEE